MAIAYDAATDGGNNSGATNSKTFAHTCTGSDLALLVAFTCSDVAANDRATGVTYNGVAMTQLGKRAASGSNSSRWLYLYGLIGPASGSNNVVISINAADWILCGATSYTGVGSFAATTTNIGTGTSLTTSLTTPADNCWLALAEGGYDAGNTPGAGAGTTRRTFEGAFKNWALFDSNGAKSPAGSYGLTTTFTGSTTISHVLTALVPPGGGGGGGSTFNAMLIMP